MNLALCIKYLFPAAVTLLDYSVSQPSDGPARITRWEIEAAQPTEAELTAAWAAITAQAQLRAGLLAAWEATFTAGEKALLGPVFAAAVAAFDAGDVAGAKALIATIPSDLSASLAVKRDAIVGLFPEPEEE